MDQEFSVDDDVVINMRVRSVYRDGLFVSPEESRWLALWVPRWDFRILKQISQEYSQGYEDAYTTMEVAYQHNSHRIASESKYEAEQNIAKFLESRGVGSRIIDDVRSGMYLYEVKNEE